jgi:hypothetical protein
VICKWHIFNMNHNYCNQEFVGTLWSLLGANKINIVTERTWNTFNKSWCLQKILVCVHHREKLQLRNATIIVTKWSPFDTVRTENIDQVNVGPAVNCQPSYCRRRRVELARNRLLFDDQSGTCGRATKFATSAHVSTRTRGRSDTTTRVRMYVYFLQVREVT